MNEQAKARRVVADFVKSPRVISPDIDETLTRAKIAADARRNMRDGQRRRLARACAVIAAILLLGLALFSIPEVRAFVAQIVESFSSQSDECQYSIQMDNAELLRSNSRNGRRYQEAVYRVDDSIVEIYVEPAEIHTTDGTNMPFAEPRLLTGLPIGYDAILYDDTEGVKAAIRTDGHHIEIILKSHDMELLADILQHLTLEEARP